MSTMNSPRVLAALTFLLAVIVGGSLWYLNIDDEAPPPASSTNASGMGRNATPAVGSAAPAVAAAGNANEDTSVPESLFRTEVSDATTGSMLTVQVWNRSEGVPADGAEVFVLDGMGGDRVDWGVTKGPFALHWSSVAEQHGRRFRTDADGRVDVSNFVRNSVVVARQPGAYAFKWLGDDREDGSVEILTLQHDESVTIKVVDERGQPVAGAAVGIVERIPLPGSVEQLQAQAEQLEGWLEGMQEWMRDNPGNAAKAQPELVGIERQLQTVRQDVVAAKQDAAQREREGASAASRALSRLEVRTRRQTDEDGLAVVEHFQLYRREQEMGAKAQKGGKAAAQKKGAAGKGRGQKSGGKKGGGKSGKQALAVTTFEAALLMPLAAPVTKQISIDPLPVDVIVLQKPATASLALRTVDRDGRPYTHPVHGQIEMLSEASAAWTRVMLRKQQNERTIEFPHVGLGLTFVAGCRLDDDDFRWHSGELQGPVAAGERVEVDLVVAPDAGMLFAKLVDSTGSPLRGIKPSFLISSQRGRLEGEEVVTDDEGRFHLPYKVREDQRAPYRFEIRLGDEVPTRGFAAPLAQLPEGAVSDLGEIALNELAEFVRGVVVDDGGNQIPSTHVQLERERLAGEMGFVDVPFVNTRTGEDGTFQLFGAFEPGRYRLRVQKRDHFRAYGEVRGQGSECRVEMKRKCRVVGTVLAPEWMLRERVRVDLLPVAVSVPPEEKSGSRSDQLHDHEDKTYAYFDNVWPGTYSLSFRLQGFPDPFLVIDRFVLEPGQVDLHPRLRDLDLGAYIFRFEIHPVDQNGQPVGVDRPQLTKITRADGSEQFLGLVMKGQYGEVFNTSPKLEVLPMMAGYVADNQVLAPGRSELVFRQVPPVDVVLPGLSAMAQGVHTQVVLERLEMNGRPTELEAFDGMSKRIAGWYARAKYSAAMLGEQDAARVRVTGGGPHKVILRFGQLKGSPETVELDAVEIKIVPGSEAMRVFAPFDAQIVQQALAAARTAMAQPQQGGGK